MENHWEYGGEIVRISEENFRDVGARISVRGISQRNEEMSSAITELTFHIPKYIWDSAKKDGLKLYSLIEMQGHFETWANASENNYRMRMRMMIDFLKVCKA